MSVGHTRLNIITAPFEYSARLYLGDLTGWDLKERGYEYDALWRNYTPAELGLPMYVPVYVLLLRHARAMDIQERLGAEAARLAQKYVAGYERGRDILRAGLPQPIFEEIEQAFF